MDRWEDEALLSGDLTLDIDVPEWSSRTEYINVLLISVLSRKL